MLLAVLLLASGLCVDEAFADATVSLQGDAATDEASGLGVQDFHRAKRGSAAALPDGQQVGYRYITGYENNFALVATADVAVLFVPDEVCAQLGISLDDEGQARGPLALIEALDEANADGGASLKSLGLQVHFTSERQYTVGDLTFCFAVESAGRTYAAVRRGETASADSAPADGAIAGSVANSDDSSPRDPSADAGALFCDYGTLVDASQLGPMENPGPAQQAQAFLSSVDWSPLAVSARTTLVATLIVAIAGLLIAWFTLRLGSRAKSVCDAVFSIPLVLPPSVCGFLLLYLFGKNTAFGRWLIDLGISLPFTWPAAVIAAVVVAFPFMYRAARGALESIDADLLDVARTLGWSEWRVFSRLMVPLARPALGAGVALSFARALGEFGATLFFAGNYAGTTQTIPLAIYYDWMGGDVASAGLWTLVVIVFSMASLAIINRLSAR